MSPSAITDLMRDTLMTTFWLSLPVLAVGFIVGIVVSLVQILTSIQDASVGTVPRLAAFLGALLLALPWMLTQLTDYTSRLFGDLGRFAQ